MRQVWWTLGTALFFIASGTCCGQSGSLEALGLPQDTRALIINAGDVGLCWSSHKASIDAMEKGSVTSGSAVVPCPWFPAAVRDCSRNPELAIGLQLALTSELDIYRWRPVAGNNLVPKLVDEEGYLWRHQAQVYRSVKNDIQQVVTELQAQIDQARKMGLKPTHLDSHVGTLYYNEDYFKAACNLVLENDIPFMAFAYNDQTKKIGARRVPYYTPEVAEKLEAAGFPLLDAFLEGKNLVAKTYDQTFLNFREAIRNLRPGVSYMLVYMGIESPELKAITSQYDIGVQQYRIFTSPEMARLLEEEGIHLLNWRDLKEAIWDKRDKSIKRLF